jgi:hypothetical protein
MAVQGDLHDHEEVILLDWSFLELPFQVPCLLMDKL